MEPIRSIPEPERDAAYFSDRIQGIAAEILPPNVSIDKGLGTGAQLLQLTHERYGDNPYHNDEHPLTVLRRHWKLLTIIQEILPDKIDDSVYDLSIAPVCGHDVFNEPGAPAGENERRSAETVQGLMLEADYSEEEAQIGYDMVIGTTVIRDESGIIVQNNLRTGSKHPAKWTLANADINGIPMEGISRMVGDALDLYSEFNGMSREDFYNRLKDPSTATGTTVAASQFFQTQAQFLGDRLAAVDEDLSYYFTDDEKALLQPAFNKEFSGTTRDAVSAARVLFRFPKIPELIITQALSSAETATSTGVDRVERFKQHIAELLHRTGKDD